MLTIFDRLSDRIKLLTPIGLCLIALLSVGWLSWDTIERVKLGGPMVTDVISSKELNSDVLPPPMYLVETHLAVQESAGVGDPKRVAEFADKYTALRKEYDERQAHWARTLAPGPIRDLVTGPLNASARDYFLVCEQQLLPALRAGDEAKARELANGVLKDKYRAQRAVVDQVVALVDAENEAQMKAAVATVRTSTRTMFGLMVCVPLLAAVIAVVIVRRVTGATRAALARAADAESLVAAVSRTQGMIEFRPDGTIVRANDTFLKAMGYTFPEIDGKHHSMFCDPAVAAGPEYREMWAKLNRGEPVAADVRRLAKGGREVWLQASYTPICDGSGKVVRVVQFATDVTERVRAAQVAETLSLVANNTDVSVIMTDANGLTRYINPGFTKLTGYELADVKGKKPGDVLQGPLTDPATRRRIREKLARREPVVEEIYNYHKDGRGYWISVAINPVFDGHGNVTHFVGVQADITVTKTLQLELKARMEAIGRSQGVVEFTADGKITAANDAFLKAMGYSFPEIDGKHHSMFCDPAVAAGPEYREMWAKLNRGEAAVADFPRLARGGRPVWIRGSYNPIPDVTGKIVKVVKFAIDVTAAKQAEVEAARVQAMIDSAQMNVMFADRDFKIRYANPMTIQTLRSLEKYLPIKAQDLIGQSIDVFHKRPEHQRRLLSDPGTVPPVTLIQVGPETLELRVSPVVDAGRNHLGTMVTWGIVTERIAAENKIKEATEREREQATELQQKVNTILATVNALADGDFTQEIPDLGGDAIGQMAAALNAAVATVRTALGGVREVSEQLADASGQLASASEEIASGAQEQASSLEETASTLEEITATVKQNADSAQQARQLASGSRDVAEKGGQVVGQAVSAMEAINQSSKKIADIITAIDEIAFQTNLLALNAAVEAARAGEQGRGFAVVATEVRKLAQRSATAAKEIKSLINDSVRKVDAGTELVNRSGQTLHEIVTSVKRVTDIVSEIAAASKEQSAGIDQVNKAVSQMDGVTQRNAGQTEEMSATAQTLTEQATQLRDLVAQFKLDKEAEKAPPAKRAAGKPRAKTAPQPTKPRPAVSRALTNGNGKHHELDLLGRDDEKDGFTEF